MDANEVAILIKARDEASKVMKDVGDNAGGLGKTLGDIGKIAGGFVLAQGILQAPGFLLDAAKAAAEDEAATARLQQAVRNLGGDYDAQIAKVNDAIAAGQKMAFTDDDVRDSFQKLAAATGDSDEALRRQKLAMDLARGANIPLAQASTLLGKINAENVEVFKRMGITIGENATEADALAAVQAKFGGQADAYAKSTAGQFAQAKIAMGEIVESIGAAVLPALTKVGTTIAAQLPKVQKFIGEFASGIGERLAPALVEGGKLLERFGGFFMERVIPAAEQALPALDAIGSAIADFAKNDALPIFVHIFETLVEGFKIALPIVIDIGTAIADKLAGPLKAVVGFVADHKDEFKLFAAAMAIAVPVVFALAAAHTAQATAATAAAVAEGVALAPVLAISAAIALLILGIVELVKHWDDVTARFPIVGQASDALKAKFEEFTVWVTGTFVPAVKNIADTVADAVRTAVAFVQDHWDEIRAVIEPAIQALKLIIQYEWDQIRVIFETVLGVIKGIVDVFMGVFTGDWERAWNGVKEIVGSVWDGIKGVIENAIGLIKGLAGLIFDAGMALGGALLDGLKQALSATAGFAGDVAGAVLQAVKSVVNRFVIEPINRALEFTIPVPGLPDIHINPPDIPRLASGGIVRARPGGTLALLGEGGKDEAVIPLDGKHGLGGGTVVYGSLQIVLPNVRNGSDFMREIDQLVVAV